MVSDLGLPDMTGWDVMNSIRSIAEVDPVYKKGIIDCKRVNFGKEPLKAIALSGFGMEGDIKKSIEAGFQIHLTKPVQTNMIQAAISQLFM